MCVVAGRQYVCLCVSVQQCHRDVWILFLSGADFESSHCKSSLLQIVCIAYSSASCLFIGKLSIHRQAFCVRSRLWFSVFAGTRVYVCGVYRTGAKGCRHPFGSFNVHVSTLRWCNNNNWLCACWVCCSSYGCIPISPEQFMRDITLSQSHNCSNFDEDVCSHLMKQLVAWFGLWWITWNSKALYRTGV